MSHRASHNQDGGNSEQGNKNEHKDNRKEVGAGQKDKEVNRGGAHGGGG